MKKNKKYIKNNQSNNNDDDGDNIDNNNTSIQEHQEIKGENEEFKKVKFENLKPLGEGGEENRDLEEANVEGEPKVEKEEDGLSWDEAAECGYCEEEEEDREPIMKMSPPKVSAAEREAHERTHIPIQNMVQILHER